MFLSLSYFGLELNQKEMSGFTGRGGLKMDDRGVKIDD
jgi:hypothetical protein